MKHYYVPGTVLHACINSFKPHSTTRKSAILLLPVYTRWRKWSVVRLNKLQRSVKWWWKEPGLKQACPGAQSHPLLPVYTEVAELGVNGCDGHSHMPHCLKESAIQASHIRISGKAHLRLCLDLLARSLSLNIFKYIWPLCTKFSRVRSKIQPCLNETIVDSLKPPFWSRGAEVNSRFPIMTIHVQNNYMCLQ